MYMHYTKDVLLKWLVVNLEENNGQFKLHDPKITCGLQNKDEDILVKQKIQILIYTLWLHI